MPIILADSTPPRAGTLMLPVAVGIYFMALRLVVRLIRAVVITNDNRWIEYEGIQSDIFDHLLAVLPKFGLNVFQAPAGADLKNLR